MDTKKIIGYLISAALAAGVTFAASKGIAIECPKEPSAVIQSEK